MKKVCHVVLTVALVLILGALASPAFAQDQRDTSDKWEFTVHFGFIRGDEIGAPSGNCVAITTNACNLTADFSHRGPIGTLPGRLSGAPGFLRHALNQPGSGPVFGLRVGYDVNPRWQLEFTYNYGRADMKISNLDQLAAIGVAFQSGSAGNDRVFEILDPATPTGNEQMYLFNANYHFKETGRVIPYVGGGFGWERWYNGPNLTVFTQTDSFIIAGLEQIRWGRSNDSATAFAFDFAGGVKIHATRRFGMRLELMDVISFPGFNNRWGFTANNAFGAFTAGQALDPTGRVHQGTTAWGQLVFTAGAFWRWQP